ncbi:MAG: hypothetical protein EHM12_00670, partial [Dehalococcoidia bacterium]
MLVKPAIHNHTVMKRIKISTGISNRNPGYYPEITEKRAQQMMISRSTTFSRYIATIVMFFVFTAASFSQVNGDYRTRASGSWNDNNTWQVYSGGAWVNSLPGDFPGAAAGAGTVNITGGFTASVTGNVPNPVAAITFAGAAQSNVIDFTGAFTLNVTGQITINPPTNNNFSNNLGVNSGTVTCASLSSTNSGHDTRICLVTISSGTLTVNGDMIMGNNSVRTRVDFSGAGSLIISGNFVTGTLAGSAGASVYTAGNFTPSTYTVSTSTVFLNGINQTVSSATFFNLVTSNAGVKTLYNNNVTVGGNLTLNNSNLAFTGTQARSLAVVGNLTGNGFIDMSPGNHAHILTLAGITNQPAGIVVGTAASRVEYVRAGNQEIFASPDYRSITINGGGDKSLNGNVSMTGTLTLTNGRVVLGDYDFSLNGTAAIGSYAATRYIVTDGNGQLKKLFASGATAAYVLPIGDGSNYSPVSLTMSANSTSRTIGVNVTDAQHPSDGTADNFISRYWSFSNDQAGTYTYTASFTFAPADLTGAYASLRVNRWDGIRWTQYNTSGGSPTITVTGVNEITAPLDGIDFTGRV